MRSCIYCGRDLEKGEACGCPQSAARRNANQSTNTENHNQTNQNAYYTGYTDTQSRAKRSWEKHKAKAQAKKNTYRAKGNPIPKGFWSNLWRFIVRFVISPVETIANPGHISRGTALVVSGISGALISLCFYFISAGVVRMPYGLMSATAMLNPVRMYQRMMYMGYSLIIGIVIGIIVFFVFSGIFYLINRFIFRRRTAYWDFAPRLSLNVIPITLMSIVGILFGMFSSVTLAILVVCGVIGSVVLTYEGLKTEWISYSPGRVMYSMMLGYFAFTSIIGYLIRIFLIR